MTTHVFDTINIEEITLAEPKASRAASSCKTAYIQYRGQKLRIQTPVQLTPWDLKIKQMDPSSNASCNMSLSFATESSDPDVKAFRDFLVKFDEKIKTLAASKSSSLGKKADKKVIDANFKDSVKVSDKYPAVFSPKVWLRLKNDDGDMKNIDHVSMDMKVFNMDCEPIDYTLVTKGCPAALIVSPSYVWASSLGVGVTWTATECMCKPSMEEECGFKMVSSFDKFKRKNETSDSPKNSKARTEFYDDELEDESVNF